MNWLTLNEREKFTNLANQIDALIEKNGSRPFNIDFSGLCDTVTTAKQHNKMNNSLIKLGNFDKDIITEFSYLDDDTKQLVPVIFRPKKGRNIKYWFIVEYLKRNYVSRQVFKNIMNNFNK